MEKKLIIFFVIIFIISIIMMYIAYYIQQEASKLYKETHKEKLRFEDHGKYSEVIPYTEVSTEWNEERYLALTNAHDIIENLCPLTAFLSIYSIILVEFIYAFDNDKNMC